MNMFGCYYYHQMFPLRQKVVFNLQHTAKSPTGFPFLSLLFLRQTDSDNSQWRQRKY